MDAIVCRNGRLPDDRHDRGVVAVVKTRSRSAPLAPARCQLGGTKGRNGIENKKSRERQDVTLVKYSTALSGTTIEFNGAYPQKSKPTPGGIIPEQLEDDLMIVRSKVNELAQIKSAMSSTLVGLQSEIDELINKIEELHEFMENN